MDRCRYPSKPCLNARAVKLNGDLHRFCEQHRRQANQNQMRWSKRKQTVRGTRRGGEEDRDDEGADGGSDGGVEGSGGYGALPPPPPPGLMTAGPPPQFNGPPNSIHTTSASLSHMSLHSHNHHMLSHGGHPPHPHGHPHAMNHSHPSSSRGGLDLSTSYGNGNAPGGMISSFQDHLARGGGIPGTSTNSSMNVGGMGAGMRRELAPAPMNESMVEMLERSGSRPPPVNVEPIQTALPPLLPQQRTVDQPEPSAVHALLMLAPNAVMPTTTSTTSMRHPRQDQETSSDVDDAQVRRELKRAKSNEWIARPTLSPAGLPYTASLAPPHGASIAVTGRSASWQPPVREEMSRESLVQWMQRKQASLPSLSNYSRNEKRPYDSISSSAVPPSASAAEAALSSSAPNASGYLHHHPHHHHPLEPGAVPGSLHSMTVPHSGGYPPVPLTATTVTTSSKKNSKPVKHEPVATTSSTTHALV